MSDHHTEAEKEILDRLRSLYAAYSSQDIDRVISHFAPDQDFVGFGTCEDERVEGVENLRESWAQSLDEPHKLDIEITWSGISCRETVAWFSVELLYSVALNEESTLNLVTRVTGVMEKLGQEWLIRQYHASHPTPSVRSRYRVDIMP